MHAGPSHTLSQIRTRYWIPHGKAEVKRILSKCSTCRKYQGGPFQMPKMSAWPNKKISRSPPFSYTGLDYIGPLYVKDGEERTKVWICLFTCAVVRAVHLEIVMDLTPEEFLMSLRRFIARRGTPIEITLDNAPQFKVTKTVIDKAWEEIVTNQDVMCYTTNQKIRWNFIIEYAPWIGGFYEILVAMVKSAIRKSIGKILLNKIQLITFITEAEAVINSRPIVHVLEDLDIPVTLTPAHFLTPITTLGTPESNKKENQDNDPDYEVEPKNSAEKLLESWRKGQKHLDCLWKLWNEDYLLGLRERYQSSINQPRVKSVIPPQLNQVVHIHEKLPRGTWKIGIIHKLIESHDGEVRAAEIRIPSGKLLRRPINLLYPLETVQPIKDDEEAIEAPKNTEEFEQNVNTRGRKSTRKSALEARDRIKGQSMIDEY